MYSMYSVWEIADWFEKWSEYKDEEMDKLKMMKFLFYAQAQYVKNHGRPLFEEKIEAWDYGPVVPVVYNNGFHEDKYEIQTDFDWNNYREEDSRFLVKVWNTYHTIEGSNLIDYSHNESVWRTAYIYRENNAITVDDMIDAYVCEDYAKSNFEEYTYA